MQAIGLSGQMHGAVLLDAQDRVLRPAILWNDTRSSEECVQMMAELPAPARRAERAAAPLFLPYLAGERTPHNDAQVRGSFHGLSDGLAALKAAGSTVQRLSLVGGGSRSALWAQQLASALDIEIVTHASSTVGGALGAARLGWLATGADPRAVCLAPAVEATYTPDRAEQDVLLPRYAQFKALYLRA